MEAFWLMIITIACVNADQNNVKYDLALAMDNLVCPANEQTFSESYTTQFMCFSKCSADPTCKSMALDSGTCMGCSNGHIDSNGLDPQTGFKIYNKATNIGDDCSTNPCTGTGQVCVQDGLQYTCGCELGSEAGGTDTCRKFAALIHESCVTLPCYGDNHVSCTNNVCECTVGATYFPESGLCQMVSVPYQEDCSVDLCQEPRQICSVDNICICDHGHKYDSSSHKCVTECTSFAQIIDFQVYTGWTMVGHLLARIPTNLYGCKVQCRDEPKCRSFTQNTVTNHCHLHNVTALNVPSQDYKIDENNLYPHYVRNCG